jgi:hypothetical protein
MKFEFGNDPAKIEGYKKFWKREPVKRPLVGFSLKRKEMEALRPLVGL